MVYFIEENLVDMVYSTDYGRISFFYDYSRVDEDYKFIRRSYKKDEVDGWKEYDEESVLYCTNDADEYYRDDLNSKHIKNYESLWDGVKRIEKFLSYYAVKIDKDDHNYIMM